MDFATWLRANPTTEAEARARLRAVYGDGVPDHLVTIELWADYFVAVGINDRPGRPSEARLADAVD